MNTHDSLFHNRLKSLRTLAVALAETLEPAEVARIVAEHAVAALRAPAGLVGIVRETTPEPSLEIVSESGYGEELIAPWRIFPLSANVPLAEAVRTGSAVFVEDESDWRRRFDTEALATVDPHVAAAVAAKGPAWAAIPLRSGERVIGVLGISLPGGHVFGSDEREFLEVLAQQCAQALEHAQLFAAAQAARHEAERQRDRIAFLAEASALLAASLDFTTTLEQVARLTVPRCADWCAVDMKGTDGTEGETVRVAVAHVDPERIRWAEELARRYPTSPDSPTGVPAVLRTGQAEFYAEVTDEMLIAGAQGDPERLEMVRAFGFRSVLIVPMRARGRTLGAITLVTTDDSGRYFTEDDVALMTALGERAGLAVDNARLHQETLESEARFRRLADTAPVLIWITDAHGANTYVNQPWMEFTGSKDPGAFADDGWFDFAHPDDSLSLKRALRAAFTDRVPVEMEFRLRRHDGEHRYVLNRGKPRWDEAGNFIGFIGSCVDVSDRKDAEAALAAAQAHHRALLREVLASVSEGRLQLVESPADLPPPLPAVGPEVVLTLHSLRALRQQTQAAAQSDEFPDERWQDLQTAVGEAAMNAVVHAGGGRAHVGAVPGMIQVRIEDQGTGISVESIPRATLQRGFSSAGTLGHGFWMILKTCDRIFLCTGPTGTTVVLEQEREPPLPAWLRDA